MDSRPGYQRGNSNHLGYGGSASNSPALTGAQAARRRKQPLRPADFKLQVIIIGSRGVGKTSLMERFTDDTFCEACKSTVGVDFKIKTVELRGKKIRLQICGFIGQLLLDCMWHVLVPHLLQCPCLECCAIKLANIT